MKKKKILVIIISFLLLSFILSGFFLKGELDYSKSMNKKLKARNIDYLRNTGFITNNALVVSTLFTQSPVIMDPTIAIVYVISGYQVYSREVYTSKFFAWIPPLGGSNCEKCNNLKVAGENACSEYVCHSYGASCEWNQRNEFCYEENINDFSPPTITPATEIDGEKLVFYDNVPYEYLSSSAGAKLIYNKESGGTGKCVPAYNNIKLVFNTNEKAECKISIEQKTGETSERIFEQMEYLNEGGAYTKTHILNLPSIATANKEALEAAGYKITNGGNYKFYIRCRDLRGNINSQDYIMSFCVQTGPDSQAPKIIRTSPENNGFLAFNKNKIENFEVYLNKPADCRWDIQRKNYQYMQNNFLKCSQSINDPLNNNYEFGCKGELTGIKEGVNKFYISCLGQPELKGTSNEKLRKEGEIYEYTIKGTSKLLITDVKINNQKNNSIIKGSVEPLRTTIEVKTYGGAEEGKARCQYSTNEKTGYSLFYNNNNREYLLTNTDVFYLKSGNYAYYIQCFDIAGNIETTLINFTVEIDKDPPQIVRVYREDNSLKIITSEESECYYTDFGCIYDLNNDGILFYTEDGITHKTEWNIEHDFYVKCKDKYGNRPDEGLCTLEVRPFEIAQLIESE